jgi:hypothetical protein
LQAINDEISDQKRPDHGREIAEHPGSLHGQNQYCDVILPSGETLHAYF